MEIKKILRPTDLSEAASGAQRYVTHLSGILGAEVHLETIGADLVIIAARGLKNIFPFGSVAERVIKNSPVPVLTINPKTQSPS